MPRFLSDEWVTALDEAAAASATLEGVLPDLEDDDELVVEHVVTGVPEAVGAGDDDDERAFHLVLGAGPARAGAGRAPVATVRFTQSYDTARAISRGESSAQAAFMAGELRVGGRVDMLLAHHAALAGVDDVFADLRSRTEY